MAHRSTISILSPKRNARLQTGWEGFFPYYAGYPTIFATALLKSADLPIGATVLDPWNGSGTTIHAAAQLGINGIGIDINPAMVIVAKARLLPSTEADSLVPLGKEIVAASHLLSIIGQDDPLRTWFSQESAEAIRGIERAICSHLIGGLGHTNDLVGHMSHFAAAMYISLFAVCRRLVNRFYSSNPTWMRLRRPDERRVKAERGAIEKKFLKELAHMSAALQAEAQPARIGSAQIRLGNSAAELPADCSADFVLTSPPYCTRIDYTSATRIELAIASPLLHKEVADLSREMLGSIRVPVNKIELNPTWGKKCAAFLRAVKKHPSKASAGYYLRTHLDYFDKLGRSLSEISRVLRPEARAIFVVQDSFYKEIHNDLPSMFVEIAEARNLTLVQRQNFYSARSMAGINRNSRLYNRRPGAVESVLCFEKK